MEQCITVACAVDRICPDPLLDRGAHACKIPFSPFYFTSICDISSLCIFIYFILFLIAIAMLQLGAFHPHHKVPLNNASDKGSRATLDRTITVEVCDVAELWCDRNCCGKFRSFFYQVSCFLSSRNFFAFRIPVSSFVRCDCFFLVEPDFFSPFF